MNSFAGIYRRKNAIGIIGVAIGFTAIWFRGFVVADEVALRVGVNYLFVESFRGDCFVTWYSRIRYYNPEMGDWRWAAMTIDRKMRLPIDSFLTESGYCSGLFNKRRQLR